MGSSLPFVLVFLGACCILGPCGALDPTSVKVRRLRNWQPKHITNRNVSLDQLTEAFRGALTATSGNGSLSLGSIEAAMEPIFKALPKNSRGRLSYVAANYLTDAYFTRVHHWHVRGLGIDPSNRDHVLDSVHGKGVLQEKAPALLESMLGPQVAANGMDLGEVARVAATLHALIMADAETLLDTAYEVNQVGLDDHVYKANLSTMLMTYILVSQRGEGQDEISERLQRPKLFVRSFAALGTSIANTLDFQRRYSLNPFVPRQYTRGSLTQITRRTIEEYGQWQDLDCQAMKRHLVSLDPLRSGRVPLGVFYDQPANPVYNFSESESFLRQSGSLDDSVPGDPQVLISNYVLCPENCFTTSTYYQYCCLSECDGLMDSIERSIGAPEALPENMLELLTNLSTSTVEAPWEVTRELVKKMHVIADRHGGRVPIYGRLFRQWLHYAFPYECPFPHLPREVLAAAGNQSRKVGPGDRLAFVEAARHRPAEVQPSLALWSDDEQLLFEPVPRGSLRWLGAAAALLAAALSMFRLLLQQARCWCALLFPGGKSEGSIMEKIL